MKEPEKGPEWARSSTRFVRAGVGLVVVASALAGLWVSGMPKLAAVVCSVAGGLIAMVVGMVSVGVRYHRELDALTKHAGDELGKVRGEMDKLRSDVVSSNRQFGILAVAMAKTVADNVAAKIVARHTARLPGPEHVEAAMREAQATVTEEIVAYGELMRGKK